MKQKWPSQWNKTKLDNSHHGHGSEHPQDDSCRVVWKKADNQFCFDYRTDIAINLYSADSYPEVGFQKTGLTIIFLVPPPPPPSPHHYLSSSPLEIITACKTPITTKESFLKSCHLIIEYSKHFSKFCHHCIIFDHREPSFWSSLHSVKVILLLHGTRFAVKYMYLFAASLQNNITEEAESCSSCSAEIQTYHQTNLLIIPPYK